MPVLPLPLTLPLLGLAPRRLVAIVGAGLVIAAATAQSRQWSPAHLSPPGLDVRLCWHGADGRVLAVASRHDAATMETWEWDGAQWHERYPALAPGVRQ